MSDKGLALLGQFYSDLIHDSKLPFILLLGSQDAQEIVVETNLKPEDSEYIARFKGCSIDLFRILSPAEGIKAELGSIIDTTEQTNN